MLALRAAMLARPQTELAREGTQVRYVRTTFLPDDETCFHVFEAVSGEVVAEVFRRAGHRLRAHRLGGGVKRGTKAGRSHPFALRFGT